MPAFTGPEATQAAGWSRQLTGHRGSAVFASAVMLHVPDSAVVADVTYGDARFWYRVPMHWFTVLASDLYPRRPGCMRADFRRLPYASAVLDVVVFDPPYLVNANTWMAHYAEYEQPARLDFARIMDLYTGGMTEACRVLRPGGQLWVKGMDQADHRRPLEFEVAITGHARDLGLALADRFTFQRRGGLHNGGRPSFLLIFEKKI